MTVTRPLHDARDSRAPLSFRVQVPSVVTPRKTRLSDVSATGSSSCETAGEQDSSAAEARTTMHVHADGNRWKVPAGAGGALTSSRWALDSASLSNPSTDPLTASKPSISRSIRNGTEFVASSNLGGSPARVWLSAAFVVVEHKGWAEKGA
jgi:hypothetical protein